MWGFFSREKANQQPLTEDELRMFEVNPPSFEAGVIDSKWVTTTLEMLKNENMKRQVILFKFWPKVAI